MRNQMAEDCLTKRRLLEWFEKSRGLDDYGYALAYKDYVTAVSLWVKSGFKKHYDLVRELFGYNILHVTRKDRPANFWIYTSALIVREGFRKFFKKTV